MVFTSSRADYGLLRHIIKRIMDSPRLELSLVVAGSHLLPFQGHTVEEILRDDIPIDFLAECELSSDTPDGLVDFVSCGLAKLNTFVKEKKPDLVLLLGDRYELFIPAITALLYRIPIAHLCGGEITQGALDEQVRHAITKMAHLHFVGTFLYARHLRLMGEESWRIHVVGEPGIENIAKGEYLDAEEIGKEFGLDLSIPTLLITYHPETVTGEEGVSSQVRQLLATLKEFKEYQQVITYPGLEVKFEEIIEAWKAYAQENPRVKLYKSLGSRAYLGVMKHAAAVVGNSSSGIIEAPSLKVPTVNIGDRQKGRIRAESVIDVPWDREAIIAALRKALYDTEFRSRLGRVKNPYDPYGDGNVSGRVVSVLESVPLGRRLLEKKLDFPTPEEVARYDG